jgi:hypothetical protein
MKMNNSYSDLSALPLEVYLPENMSINLRGETIPMACSCFLEKSRNIQQVDSVYSIQKLRPKQLFRSGKSRRKKEIEEENGNNSNRRKYVMKQMWKDNDEHLTKKNEQSMKKLEKKMPYHFNNQPNFSKTNNSYSNLLALPLDVFLSENKSINLRGETIPMACSCFVENSRNIQQENLVYLIQKFRLKHLLNSGKLRRREVVISIWLDENMNWKDLKEKKDKFLIRDERVGNDQLFGLMFWLFDLNVEAFVVGKREFPKNFYTDGERNSLENIGTIFISLQLHWSNGYCISSSSSDDG